jgi:S1-C subfamily serine protease
MVALTLLVLGILVTISTGAATAAMASEAASEAIQRVKAAVVAVGTYDRVRNPAFVFSGTGFAVGDGSLIATNAHVLPATLNEEHREALVIAIPGSLGAAAQFRAARLVAVDRSNDVALLAVDGPKMVPLQILDSPGTVRDGMDLRFTGFPIGSILGLIPATHRALVSAMTPIAIPQPNASTLDAKAVRRLSMPPTYVIQLDAIAYPGSSGSPLFDPQTGMVVGIVNAVLLKGSRETALSQPSGITYAIHASALATLLRPENFSPNEQRPR